MRGNDFQIGTCLGERDVRLDSPDDIEIVSASELDHVLWLCQWSPKLDSLRLNWKFEIGRHHTDHGVALAVQCDLFLKKCLSATETPLPQSITDYRDLIASGLFIFGRKTSAD